MLRLAEIIGTSLKRSEHGLLTEFAVHRKTIPADQSETLIQLRLLEPQGDTLKLTDLGNEVVCFLKASA